MKIGLYGGSFNPPHRGHEKAALAFLKGAGLDRLFVIPSGTSPHKTAENAPPKEDRLELCRRAFPPLDGRIEVWDGEIRSEGVSYTYLTVRAFRERFPGDELFLLTGTDMFLCIDRWKEAESFLSAVTLVCAPRTDEIDPILAKKSALEANFGVKTLLLSEKPYIISSSEVRNELRESFFSPALSPAVNDYIGEKGLYGIPRDPRREEILARLRKTLSPPRLAHVLSVERECVSIARLLKKENELLPDLSYAALLHDLMREAPPEEEIAYLKKEGITPPRDLLEPPVLLHGFAAAVAAEREYSLPAPYVYAVRHHTTGEDPMDLPLKILYLADGIEETRRQPALKEARAAFYGAIAEGKDPAAALDAACLDFLIKSAAHETNKCGVHPATLRAIAAMRRENDHKE